MNRLVVGLTYVTPFSFTFSYILIVFIIFALAAVPIFLNTAVTLSESAFSTSAVANDINSAVV